MLFPPKGERGCVAPTRKRTIRRTAARAVLYVIGYLEHQQTHRFSKIVVKFKKFNPFVLVAEIA
jgi:hypothetical protein